VTPSAAVIDPVLTQNLVEPGQRGQLCAWVLQQNDLLFKRALPERCR
jgi:hypothetical protein